MPQPKGPSKGSILLVEDDHDIRDLLTEILQLEGYTVTSVPNGLQALDSLQKGPPPDIILLDVMMPTMSGTEFRAKQSEIPPIASIPVVVISATSKDQQQAEVPGALNYLTKPLNVDELIRTLNKLV